MKASLSQRLRKAQKDGWEDGFAGATDMSSCPYRAAETRQAYAEGRVSGLLRRHAINPPQPSECPERQAELQRLIGRTIVKAEGSSRYEACFTLTLDDGYVVEVSAIGDDATRVILNGT